MRRIARLGVVVAVAVGLAACSAGDVTGPQSGALDPATVSGTDATLTAKVVQGPRPVRGNFDGSDVYGQLCAGGTGITVTSTGYGTLTHLGRTVLVQVTCFDLGDFSVIGTSTWTMTAANGDQVEGVMTGYDYTAYGFDLYLEITGGTGRFAAATGEMTAYVYSNVGGGWTSPTDGWIAY